MRPGPSRTTNTHRCTSANEYGNDSTSPAQGIRGPRNHGRVRLANSAAAAVVGVGLIAGLFAVPAAVADPLIEPPAVTSEPTPTGEPTGEPTDPVESNEPTPDPTDTAEPTEPTAPPVSQWPHRMVIGKSVRGRPIVAQRQGNPNAEKVLLLVGVIHGTEKAGRSIINQVRKTQIPADADTQVWTIRSMNPDGMAATSRYNARRVDLNRNFPTGWSRQTTGAGKAPASEPETQALISFISELRPDATFVYHQDWNMVLGTCSLKTRDYALRYAKFTGLRNERCGRTSYTGTMGMWFNSTFPGYLLTVELPGSRKVTAKKVTRWRKSVLLTLTELPDLDPTSVNPTPTDEPIEPEPSASPTPQPSTSP